MQEFKQAEKAASLSQLVHDLNQPLSAISTYAHSGQQLIDNGVTDPERMKELFGKIVLQCGRATALSNAMGTAAKALSSGPDAS